MYYDSQTTASALNTAMTLIARSSHAVRHALMKWSKISVLGRGTAMRMARKEKLVVVEAEEATAELKGPAQARGAGGRCPMGGNAACTETPKAGVPTEGGGGAENESPLRNPRGTTPHDRQHTLTPTLCTPTTMHLVRYLDILSSKCICISYTWALTHKAWNSLIHALHGNTTRPNPISTPPDPSKTDTPGNGTPTKAAPATTAAPPPPATTPPSHRTRHPLHRQRKGRPKGPRGRNRLSPPCAPKTTPRCGS